MISKIERLITFLDPGTVDLLTAFQRDLPWYIGDREDLICTTTGFTSLSQLYLKFESSSGDVVLTGCNGTISYHQGNPISYGIPVLPDSECASAFNQRGFSIQFRVMAVEFLSNGVFSCVGIETDLGHLEVNSVTSYSPADVRGKQ